MSALAVDPPPAFGQEWDDIVRMWEETDAPEGCTVEIIEGIVTVSPPPNNRHNFIAHRVHRRLLAALPEDWGVYQTLGAAVPSRNSLYIPDLAVVADSVVCGEESNFIPAAAAELVVEITSKSTASYDRIKKAEGYAQAGVPFYLLIDCWAPGGPTVTLYGEPKDAVYRTLSAVKLGEPIHLPEPFGLELGTEAFVVG
ncbi:Uma2 family endonuclease [Streptomyces sp. NPDC050610]|uniref:Uma2 family endonuclease n=1 Tax=Streptomyces sp. NPDC050610 TaxID=3157097 RepID=UPI00342BA3D5